MYRVSGFKFQVSSLGSSVKLLMIMFVLLFVSVPYFSFAQIEFQRTYGGVLINEGRGVQQTLDGGYIIAGSTSSFGDGSTDVLLIKTDSLGNAQFMKTYGGSNIDRGYAVLQLKDSGYAVAGYTNSFGNGGYDGYLIRTDKNGDVLWTKTYGGADWDFIYSIKQTPDSGFVMAGNTYSYGYGGSEGWIVKVDSNGVLLWQQTFLTNDDDFLNSVDIGFHNTYIVTGYEMNGVTDSSNIIAASVSSAGDSLWYYSYEDILNIQARVVHSISDSTYLIGGCIFVDSVQTNAFLMKIDTIGHQVWFNNSVVNKTGFNDLFDFVELPNNNLVLAATNSQFGAGGIDIYQDFTDRNGNWISAPTHGGAGTDIGYSIGRTSDNGFIIAGETNSWPPGLEAVYLVKTDSGGITTPNDSIIIGINLYKDNKVHIVLFPNPAHSEVTIDLNQTYFPISNSKMNFQLFNSLGEMVVESLFNENKHNISLENISSGLYFYCLSANGIIYSKGKLVIE